MKFSFGKSSNVTLVVADTHEMQLLVDDFIGWRDAKDECVELLTSYGGVDIE